ncbi:MAG TPA: DUF4274 domain-containing protein [Anaerolineae bacterium]|nr:DUF4274 domain-containing protein [Anaerolineae bacterium]
MRRIEWRNDGDIYWLEGEGWRAEVIEKVGQKYDPKRRAQTVDYQYQAHFHYGGQVIRAHKSFPSFEMATDWLINFVKILDRPTQLDLVAEWYIETLTRCQTRIVDLDVACERYFALLKLYLRGNMDEFERQLASVPTFEGFNWRYDEGQVATCESVYGQLVIEEINNRSRWRINAQATYRAVIRHHTGAQLQSVKLTSFADAEAWLRGQIDGMRAPDFSDDTYGCLNSPTFVWFQYMFSVFERSLPEDIALIDQLRLGWFQADVCDLLAELTDIAEESWIGYLKNLDPSKWHQIVQNWNPDDGIRPLYWLIRQSECDRGTVMWLYWHTPEEAWRDFTEQYLDNYMYWLFTEIEQRMMLGYYQRQEIAYDPAEDPEVYLMVKRFREGDEAIPPIMMVGT